jgi:hypothetical protein
MGLADTRRPQQEQRLAMGHPAAGGQVADVAGIEGRLGREVEAAQVAMGGEVGDLAGHLDPALALEWPQRRPLLAMEPHDRRLAGRACSRTSAISRIHQARCASSAAQLVKAWPAMALCLT